MSIYPTVGGVASSAWKASGARALVSSDTSAAADFAQAAGARPRHGVRAIATAPNLRNLATLASDARA